MMSHTLLLEKQNQIQSALAHSEKAKHDLQKALVDKTSEAHALFSHFSQQLEAKNEMIFNLKKQIEFLQSRSDLILEDKLHEVKRKYLASEQTLRQEIEELLSIRADNELKSKSIISLQRQLDEDTQRHAWEMQEIERNMELEREKMDERVCRMQKTFEAYSSDDKLLKLMRTLVSDNEKMADQLYKALSQLEALSCEQMTNQEIVEQCRREVELYMQSNDLNIKLNVALKKENRNLKSIIKKKLNEQQIEDAMEHLACS
jgi:hypothetical protein